MYECICKTKMYLKYYVYMKILKIHRFYLWTNNYYTTTPGRYCLNPLNKESIFRNARCYFYFFIKFALDKSLLIFRLM